MTIELQDLIAALAAPRTTIESASPSHSLPVGKAVFIRTVTYHYTGRIVSVTDSDIVLEDAAWIADSGRYHDALRDGIERQSASEIEPIPERVIIPRGVIVDCVEYAHTLPRSQK